MGSPFVETEENDFLLNVDGIKKQYPNMIVEQPKPLIAPNAIAPMQSKALYEKTKSDSPDVYSRLSKLVGENKALSLDPSVIMAGKDQIEAQAQVNEYSKYANNEVIQKSLKNAGFTILAKDDLPVLDKIGNFFNSSINDVSKGWALGKLQSEMNRVVYDVSRQKVDDTTFNRKKSEIEKEITNLDFEIRQNPLNNKLRVDNNLKIFFKKQELSRLANDLVFSQMTPDQQEKYKTLMKEQETLDPSDNLFETVSSVASGSFDVLSKSFVSGTKSSAIATAAASPSLNPYLVGISAGGGFVHGFLTTAWTESAKQLAAISYNELRSNGVSQDTARTTSAWVGGIGGSLEIGSLGVFGSIATKPVAKVLQTEIMQSLSKKVAAEIASDSTSSYALKQFAKDYGTVVAAETGTEVLQEAIAIAAQDIALNVEDIETYVETEEGRADIKERLSNTAFESLKVMSVLGLGAAAPNLGYNVYISKKSQAEQALLKDLTSLSEQSKLRERSPEAMSNLTKDYSNMRSQSLEDPFDMDNEQKVSLEKANSFDTVYVDGSELSNVLRQGKLTEEELKQLVPFEEQIKTILNLGGDLQIPINDFVSKIAGTPLALRISKFSKLDPESMTEMELSQAESEKTRLTKIIKTKDKNLFEDAQRKAEYAAIKAKQDSLREDIDFVKETYSSKFEKLGFNKIESKTYSTFLSSFFESYSDKLGVYPSKFLEQYPLDIKRAEDVDARGVYDPKSSTIFITKDTNPSTVIHEASHFFFDVMNKVKESSSVIKEDFDKVLEFFEVSNDQWQSLSFEERSKFEERFARNFEVFMYEGKAPSNALRTVFNIFKDWLKRVYSSIRKELNYLHNKEFGEDLPFLTPELKGVFERLLATDAAIQEQMEIENIKMMFDEKPEGVSESDYNATKEAFNKVKESALVGLEVDSLKTMRWVSNAQSEYLKQYQKDNKKIKDKISEEVYKEISEIPVFKLRAYLATGDVSNIDDRYKLILTNNSNRLDSGLLKDLLPKDKYEKIPKNFKSAKGLNPDFLAEVFGYKTGLELVNDLIDTPAKKDVAESMVQDRLMAEEGFKSIQDIKEEMNMAIHSKALSRFVAAELKMMSKTTKSTRLLNAAASSLSQEKILGIQIKDLNPKYFISQSTKQSKIAMDLWKKGNRDGSIDAKYKQLYQTEMAKRALEFQKRLNTSLSLFKKFFKQPSSYKNQDFDFITLGQYILSNYGFGTPKQMESTEKALKKLREYDPETYESLSSVINSSELKSQSVESYRDLTVSEFQDLDSAIRTIWDQATNLTKVERDGKKVEIDLIVGEIVPQIEEMMEKPDTRSSFNTATQLDKFKTFFTDYIVASTKAESWAHFMDHKNPNKPVYFNLIKPIHDASNLYRIKSAELTKKINEMIENHYKAGFLPIGKIDAPFLNFTFGGEKGGKQKRGAFGNFMLGSGQGKLEILGVLLHTGNRSNYARLLAGGRGKDYPWGVVEKNESGDMVIVDDSNFKNQMESYMDQGILVKEDFDFLQNLGDLIESFKPEVQKAYKEMNGHYFDEIENTPFVNRFGAYRGWYAPIFYDMDLQTDIKIKQDIEKMQNSVTQFIPSTPKGFSKTRVAFYEGAIDIDILKLSVHVDRMTRYAYLEPKVKDVLKILRNPKLTEVLDRYNRDIKSKLLLPYLTTATSQMTYTPSKYLDWIRPFTRAAGVNTMFLNIWNTFLQLTGFSVAIGELYNVAKKENRPMSEITLHLKAAFRDRFNNSEKTAQFIYDSSNFMKGRLDDEIYDIQQRVKDIKVGKGRYSELTQWFNKNGYIFQKIVQKPIDQIVWLSSFNYYYAKYPFDKAVSLADSMVKRTQGGTNPEDLSQIQITNSLFQSMMQFMAYFNTIANLITPAIKSILKDNSFSLSKKSASVVFVYAMMLGVPNLIAQLLTSVRRGEELEDEENDGYLDDASMAFLSGQVKGALPILGAAYVPFNLAISAMDDKPYNDRVSMGPAIEGSIQGVQSIVAIQKDIVEDEETRSNDIKNLGRLFAILTGIPVSMVTDRSAYAYGVVVGQIDPENDLSLFRGMITGVAKEEEKDK